MPPYSLLVWTSFSEMRPCGTPGRVYESGPYAGMSYEPPNFLPSMR